MDLEKLVQLIRHLVSFYVVDRETRQDIKNMSDEEILNYADAAVNRAEAKNDAFINRLETEKIAER